GRNVTGVQTCALPISFYLPPTIKCDSIVSSTSSTTKESSWHESPLGHCPRTSCGMAPLDGAYSWARQGSLLRSCSGTWLRHGFRSDERRAGNERVSRW